MREAVLNAATHRDYSDPGEVLVRHTVQEMVVTSPGGFLGDITPRNILRHEPVARNRALAEAFEKLGLVERAGMGRRRIYIPVLEYGKRIPEYESDGSRVTERRGKTKAATYHLNKALAKDLLGKAAYTKTKGIDSIRFREWVREFVADHGMITPRSTYSNS